MSIASLSTTQVPQSIFASATAAASASASQAAFDTQLQSLLAGQSDAGSSAAQTASQAQSGRGVPGRVHHHHHGHRASDTDANAADGTESGQTTASARNGASGTGSGGQQTPGGVLLSDLMHGLRAYGATTTLT